VSPSAALYAGIRKLGFHRVLDIRLDLPEHDSRQAATPTVDAEASGTPAG